ncbi:MAG: DUF2851 family protein [Saprospiraceae bacterium]|jgi:hypothetical protein|nr:DUF2851 family protein [Saprospiraceae bacterium]MBL0023489.1 DUF2851 family protein [Saprospiraceae bacterium]
MTNSPIKEDFLHFLWRTKKIADSHFETADGRSVDIQDYGVYNVDSGPDFFNARIRIDNTDWAGNIEMHVFSSDWTKHKHDDDNAYSNVILHVVYENDRDIKYLRNEFFIPTIELKGKIPKSYLNHYLMLMQSKTSIPCQGLIKSVDRAKINLWKYSLTAERLYQKSELVDAVFKATTSDWEETIYIMMARYFGAKVNAEPFERLAKSLPLSIINKNRDKLHVLEALYFGQAGMLEANYSDDYYIRLKKEYRYHQKKHNLKPIEAVSWKFSKLRPVNFPTVRIAQFAALVHRITHLFTSVKEAENTTEIMDLLKVTAGTYWTNHFRFDVESKSAKKVTGTDFINILIINAVAPVLYHYGKVNNDEEYTDKAIQLLESVAAEKNKITREWSSLDVSCSSAFDSQALIHLYHHYCHEFRCLQCKIGHEIMNVK